MFFLNVSIGERKSVQMTVVRAQAELSTSTSGDGFNFIINFIINLTINFSVMTRMATSLVEES